MIQSQKNNSVLTNKKVETTNANDLRDHYNNLEQSRAISRQTNNWNAEQLIKNFEQYQPMNKIFNIAQLHKSLNLRIKRYKESIYYGEFIDGKRQGKGIMIYDNKRVYEGQWKQDLKNGQGYEKFANNCTYLGAYVNGKPHGQGTYNWSNGECYEGEWKNGMKDGSGIWKGINGDSYIGQWKEGKAQGMGVHTWTNGDRYEGQFRQCLKHGEGIQKFANGDIYKGKYQNGKPSEYGQYFWNNGSYFKGNFKNGLRNGHGLWKKGPGISDKYQGEYCNDKKSGNGIFTWASGNIYKGHYDGDQRNGYGEMYWKDGTYYKGYWSQGVQHGKGQIYSPQQGLKKGIFENNILVALAQQSISQKNKSYQRPTRTLKSDKEQVLPSQKPAPFRSRARTTTKRAQSYKPSFERGSLKDSGISIKYMNQMNNNNLPQRFTRSKIKVNVSQDINEKKKQRILHSAFYLHKIHHKNTPKNLMSKTGIDDFDKHQTLEEIRNYTRNKIRSGYATRAIDL